MGARPTEPEIEPQVHYPVEPELAVEAEAPPKYEPAPAPAALEAAGFGAADFSPALVRPACLVQGNAPADG